MYPPPKPATYCGRIERMRRGEVRISFKADKASFGNIKVSIINEFFVDITAGYKIIEILPHMKAIFRHNT